MIRDARVLRAGFVPQEVEHRDAEVNHLSSVLKPITNGEPADTAIVTGPSGTGKTCISKFVIEMRERAENNVKLLQQNVCKDIPRLWKQFCSRLSLYSLR